jgi:hypothetical protein
MLINESRKDLPLRDKKHPQDQSFVPAVSARPFSHEMGSGSKPLSPGVVSPAIDSR